MEVTTPPSLGGLKQIPPTIVFVHGLGGSTANYVALIEASGVDKTHQVISFELEGHGRSPFTPGKELTIESFAQSIGEVLESVKVKYPVTIVGHSMGGVCV